ncbi:MAG: hypothetical protein QOJ00_1386 [Actinomycetota bacterium]
MTRSVTTSVVFTDLVGSTELSVSLRASEAEQVRATHFRLLREAVASSGGTEVKNLGDGLMVVYPSLGGALDGAVAMQQNIEYYNRKAARPLAVRIGVSSGDAVEEDGDYFGEPVVEASRLCAHAEGGQILTTDMVSRLARRSGHLFETVGTVTLKGLPEPVDACEVVWEAARVATPVPLPNRLAVSPPMGMVGRQLEIDWLNSAYKAASSGEDHRVVFLAGEPGIGKTTLARAVAQRAHAEGATVLYGRCDEDIAVPYQPFVEALGGFIATAPQEAFSTIDERCMTELSRLLPQVISSVPGVAEPQPTDADAERYLFFGAVTSMLTDMASSAPVVLVLDDLHWAEKSTVSLLRHLVGTLGAAQVLIVCTYRESDITALHPLSECLSALRREPNVERVAVLGLDENGVCALLEAMAGHELPEDGVELAHAVRRETGGNPFFTAEVLRHLAETGAVVQEETGRWVASKELFSIDLPESVREVVGQRVRRLGAPAHAVLTVASVIGRDFDLDLLARVAEQSEDDVLASLEAAAESLIVSEVEGVSSCFTFTHALFQRTLYDELSASRRARLHRQIGELLEIDCGDDPGDRIVELAHHWIAATRPADARKAAQYARQAGERALRTLAPDEAIRWFRQAAELVESAAEVDTVAQLDIVIGLGDAQRQAGDASYRETLLEAASTAARLGETERLVTAAVVNQRGMVSSVGTVDTERIAMLSAALDAVGEHDSPERARLFATLAAELPFSGNHERVQRIAAKAESVARSVGDDATLLAVLNLIALPMWVPENFERSVAASEEALALAERLGDPVAAFWAAMNRVYAMASSLDRAGVDSALDRASALAERIGQPYLIWQASYVRSLVVLLEGDADAAERIANEALDIAVSSGQPDALVVYGANLAGIRFHQGRLEEMIPLVADAAAQNPGLPGFAAAHAMMLCECERFEEAAALVAEADKADFHNAAYDYVWLTTTTLWADAVAALGDAAAAARLYERLAPFEGYGVLSGATFSGTVDMYLARLGAVLGHDADATRLFAQADATLRDLRAPFWRARNQVEWARLLERGTDADRAHAAELRASAAAIAEQFGCARVLANARNPSGY